MVLCHRNICRQALFINNGPRETPAFKIRNNNLLIKVYWYYSTLLVFLYRFATLYVASLASSGLGRYFALFSYTRIMRIFVQRWKQNDNSDG